MVESSGGVGTASGSRSKPASSFESAGDRLRFTVELRPDETTIVSWKKLLKEATSSKTHVPGPMVPGPSIEAHDQPVPLVPPPPAPTASASLRQPTENDANESEAQAGPNRLSNVIERIERMYAGNGSSDEEDVVLDDVPDDDEYDTEDSFIDDAELDDYFQVDNSAIKHDGFFVNRGLLERIEPTITTIQQPKKRRRKDMAKGVTSDDGNNLIKHVKTGNKGGKTSSVDKNLTTQSQKVDVPNLHHEEITADVSATKKSADFKVSDSLSGPSNGNVITQDRDTDHHKTGVMSPKNQHIKKDSAQFLDPSNQRSKDKGSQLSKSHSGKSLNNANDLDRSTQRKEKGGLVERFDLNAPPSREALPTTKSPFVQRKEGSTVRPKTSTLEKAIRELEKIVAESRPLSVEVQDPDNSFQGVKRRLPAEIKQKLAKVARLAQTSYGKIPEDLIIRLMSIVGHLMQLRTLKRNLKIMASMGLSAKQEKDDRVQKIKQEVAEMVNLRVPLLESKLGQQTANSDDFQEAGPEEKLRYSMDDALENKICDLYDLYVERLEEHSGPPIRRLYEELAAMWPSGVMVTDGIKRAIYRAKDRKKALGNPQKDQENIKKRKSVVPKAENTGLAEATNTASHIHEKSILDSRDHGSISFGDARFPIAFGINSLNTDKHKPENAKGSSSSNPIDAIPINAVLPKKKVKRKPNVDASEAQFRVDKVVPQAEERYKKQKHASVSVTKPTPQPGSENVS